MVIKIVPEWKVPPPEIRWLIENGFYLSYLKEKENK